MVSDLDHHLAFFSDSSTPSEFRLYVKNFSIAIIAKKWLQVSEQELKGGHVLYIVQTIHTVHEF